MIPIAGAPNYRHVDHLRVFGVAIPTIAGMKGVLQAVGSDMGSRQAVLWVSLREEPVIYINGRPFVLRIHDAPFANLEYTGIDTARVEEMEERLKVGCC